MPTIRLSALGLAEPPPQEEPRFTIRLSDLGLAEPEQFDSQQPSPTAPATEQGEPSTFDVARQGIPGFKAVFPFQQPVQEGEGFFEQPPAETGGIKEFTGNVAKDVAALANFPIDVAGRLLPLAREGGDVLKLTHEELASIGELGAELVAFVPKTTSNLIFATLGQIITPPLEVLDVPGAETLRGEVERARREVFQQPLGTIIGATGGIRGVIPKPKARVTKVSEKSLLDPNRFSEKFEEVPIEKPSVRVPKEEVVDTKGLERDFDQMQRRRLKDPDVTLETIKKTDSVDLRNELVELHGEEAAPTIARLNREQLIEAVQTGGFPGRSKPTTGVELGAFGTPGVFRGIAKDVRGLFKKGEGAEKPLKTKPSETGQAGLPRGAPITEATPEKVIAPYEKTPKTVERSSAVEKGIEDYYTSISAPKEATLDAAKLERKGMVDALRKRRKAKEITAAEFKKQFSEIPKASDIFSEKAGAAGIATKTTKGGKLVPAVRQSGIFVPEEFATYGSERTAQVGALRKKFHSQQITLKEFQKRRKKVEKSTVGFKDAKQGSLGGTKDPTRFIQEIDGALSVEAKAKLPGQAGPAEKSILWRTRDMMKMKMEDAAFQQELLGNLTRDLSNKQAEVVYDILEVTSRKGAFVEGEAFANNPAVKKITGDVKLVKTARELRKWLVHRINFQNKMRVLRGQKEIPFRKYYAPQQIKEATIWSEAFGLRKKPPDIMTKPELPDYIKPNAPFNPRALAREAGLKGYDLERNIKRVLADYANVSSRDIFNTSIIQNNKAFAQQLESMGFKNAASGIQNWTAEAFGGIKSQGDRFVSASPLTRKLMGKFRRALPRSVFPLNITWNTFIQTSSAVLTNTRAGTTNSLLGMSDWFLKPALRKEIAKNAYSSIIKSQRAGKISRQDVNRGMANAVELDRGKLDKVTDTTNIFTELIERHLTGWSISAGLRKGKKVGLKDQALWEFASDMGAKTQSMYNLEDLPGILRSESVKTAFPFQTFNFEVWNTMKEFAGKTGTPPATFKQRAGWVLRFMAGAQVVNEISQGAIGRKPWTIYSFFPYSGTFMKPIIEGRFSGASARGLPAPVGVVGEGFDAVKSYLATGSERKLRQWLLKYGTALWGIPGGTQLSRMVDGIIAVSNEGVVDSKGRMLFPITETKEKIRAIAGGVWTTEAGIERFEKKDKDKTTPLQPTREK